MSLTERKILEQIEIKEDGVIFVKELNQILKDNTVVSSSPHRSVFNPGDDVSSAPSKAQQAAQLFWTPEVIEAYKAEQTAKAVLLQK
jgi:hypothetical protein